MQPQQVNMDTETKNSKVNLTLSGEYLVFGNKILEIQRDWNSKLPTSDEVLWNLHIPSSPHLWPIYFSLYLLWKLSSPVPTSGLAHM